MTKWAEWLVVVKLKREAEEAQGMYIKTAEEAKIATEAEVEA
jgi:hypothetical protein